MQIIEEAETDRSNFRKIHRSRPQKNSQCEVPLSIWFDHFSNVLVNTTCDQHRNSAPCNDNCDKIYFHKLFTEAQVQCLMKLNIPEKQPVRMEPPKKS